MVGLGNSCRGMKSPPLLVAALIACIIVLGFNYWIASSRSVDLQGRIMDLEAKVQRAAAERGAVEMKKNEFQGELEKQRQQIDKIQSLHSFQIENVKRAHQEEKCSIARGVKVCCEEYERTYAVLIRNITGNERLIQDLRGIDVMSILMDILILFWSEQLKELQKEYGKLQTDYYRFQKNQTNLEKKFSYDLSQCINQMKEIKEQCEERIDELAKKGGDVAQIQENKDLSEDSKKNGQVDIQLPALKQTEIKQANLEQQKPNEDIPNTAPTVKKVDPMEAKERIKGPTDIRKQEPKAEEEKLSSDLKNPQDSLKVAEGRKEMSEMELNQSEDGKQVVGQDALQLAAEQAASEEIEREQLLNYNAKQDDSPPGKPDKQEYEALNHDKNVDYNVHENEAESETDK
ncbi:Golm1 [Columba guinea]|nr:Golm1 [Columba guinea]